MHFLKAFSILVFFYLDISNASLDETPISDTDVPFYGTRTQFQRTTETMRSTKDKREVVLVDDDFNIPTVPDADWTDQSGTSDAFTDAGSGDHPDTETSLSSTEMSKRSRNPQKLVSMPISVSDEGSGDISVHSSTPRNDFYDLSHDLIPNDCLNVACNSTIDVEIQSTYTGSVPEGTNLVFTCVAVNYSSTELLYWYRHNGTTYLLETSDNNVNISMHINESKPSHSGVYRCVRQTNAGYCCYRELVLHVYEIPAYKYHLLTAGIIVLCALVLCFVMKLWRNHSLKKYTKPFEDKNATEQSLLT